MLLQWQAPTQVHRPRHVGGGKGERGDQVSCTLLTGHPVNTGQRPLGSESKARALSLFSVVSQDQKHSLSWPWETRGALSYFAL
jgi:hypothetical protein